ncbi:prevent-host-death family protein [Brevundimonas nasdae]|uniref:Antitoxin n=1 Tax=Brevundimonas nasdae TaxID=172043 RepID=A0ABX8TJT2_9CAUL|nr:type II toxin-antitoxin system prevent-host-death family antitoxin [Brevundimonas nasdae]MBK6025619.1 type II toxin-antitoxin system prevent-host-death family antitoxin [Brevundimonas nasdae]MDQ0452251.1 prevent-host-death family protein [Brevundimonas nasdae]QYC09404.1 type II toxin-antitoxin system prevent-host-death family antitoxin [Brevundimonas nasdae]QYC15452.1 type II toxin-antitoxin system prevent-host-death family antitoxin [Brevundimonas nasdae]
MAILMAMSSYSVAEAKNNLPKLLDRMLAGEAVTITRRGVPVARLEPAQAVKPTSGPMDMDWLKRVRIKTEASVDSVTLLRRMRDEEI